MFGVLLILLAAPQTENRCLNASWPFAERSFETTNTRLRTAFDRVSKKAKPSVGVVLCDTDDETVPPSALLNFPKQRRRGIDVAYLFLPQVISRRYSVAALDGIIAHELAHLVVPIAPVCDLGQFHFRMPTVEERVACESPVDIQAAKWVGAYALIAQLEETMELLRPLMEPEERAFMERELPARIERLRLLQSRRPR